MEEPGFRIHTIHQAFLFKNAGKKTESNSTAVLSPHDFFNNASILLVHGYTPLCAVVKIL
jgi:hypothetical protein